MLLAKQGPPLFGQKREDFKISKPIYKRDVEDNVEQMQLDKLEEILLFVAYVRLNVVSINRPCMKFTKLEHVVRPNLYTMLANKLDNESLHNNLNPLTDELLIKFSTSIDVDIMISTPFKIPAKIRMADEFYKRIVLVIYNTKLAKSILAEVLLHNQSLFGPNILIPIPYMLNESHFDDVSLLANVITGFVIDVGNYYVMFFEGLRKGIINNLWFEMQLVDQVDAKTFYNSESFFQRRVYSELLSHGGVYIITLQMGVKFIVTNRNIFMDGTHSVNCRRVSTKSLIFESDITLMNTGAAAFS